MPLNLLTLFINGSIYRSRTSSWGTAVHPSLAVQPKHGDAGGSATGSKIKCVFNLMKSTSKVDKEFIVFLFLVPTYFYFKLEYVSIYMK